MTVRFFSAFAASLLLTSVAFAQSGDPAPVEPDVSRPAAPAAAPSAVDTSKDYRIGPEDLLEVWVLDQRDLSRTLQVRPDGKISLPYVNDVVAAGRTPAELTVILTEGLTGPLKTPVVSVMVREVRSARASVTGAVRMPNSYELRTGNTVLEMIAKAQGFTEWADEKDIVLIRAKDGQRIKINWYRVRDGKEPNHVLQAGDVLIVND